MRGLNTRTEVTIVGYVGGNPELRHTKSGKPVCQVSVGVSPSKDVSEWYRCTAWEGLGSALNKAVAKGDAVMVRGRLQSRTVKREDGSKRTFVDVIAAEVFLYQDPERMVVIAPENGKGGVTEVVVGPEEELPF